MSGKVGPFFYRDEMIYSDSMEVDAADKYGEFKTWGNHSEFWDTLGEKHPRFRRIQYFKCPRGRVTYNFVKDKFFIYLNPKLNNELVLEKIVQEFNLDGCNYVVDDTDEHYRL